MLALQDKNTERDVCSRGGWLVGDRWSHAGGPIYTTAINTLTLEVYYRYENAFGAIAGPAADAGAALARWPGLDVRRRAQPDSSARPQDFRSMAARAPQARYSPPSVHSWGCDA